MKKRLYLLLLLTMLVCVAFGKNQKFTLVIDAGHGGHDAGAVGAISKEKNINLNVALAFGRMVEQNCPDVRVIYTRTTDVFIPLKQRANIANKANADLFISVHTNSLPAGRVARGFEVYTLGMHRAKDNLDVAMRENSVISMEKDYKQTYKGFDPRSSESYIMFEFIQSANMEKSVELAKMIQRTVCNTAGRVNKGVHQAGFLVLRETSMPSCLIELGFITARDEEEFLNSDDGIYAMGAGIYRAFVEYKNKYNDKIVVPYQAPNNNDFSRMGHVIPQPVIQVTPNDDQKETKKEKKRKKKEKELKENKESKETKELKEPREPKVYKEEKTATNVSGLIFKVQIFAINRMLRPGSEQFKGRRDVAYYKDGNVMKYTIGESANYDDIAKLRQKLLKDFPQCFVIAFKDGQRIDINKAIDEYRKRK